MENYKFDFLVIFVCFLVQSSAEDFTLNMDLKKPIGVIDEKFLSLTLDPRILLNNIDALTTKFEKSINMARALAPAYTRLGGPSSDRYKLKHPLHSAEGENNTNSIFSETYWTLIRKWTDAAGFDVIACIAPQNLKNQDESHLSDSQSLLDLISFDSQAGYNTSWQLGYECQTRCDISANNLAEQVVNLRKTLDTNPKYAESIITGPDIVAYRTKRQQKYLQDYFSVATSALSAITWHADLAGISLRDERISVHRDRLDEDKTDLYKVIGRFTRNKPLWIAESKREECKNQFLGALVWTRRLGNAAKLGIDVVMRQPSDLARPTPDYWVSVLHKMFVGNKVFEARLQANDKTQAYFYCQCTKPSSRYQKGSITIFGVNFMPTDALVDLKGEKFNTLHEYILSPGFDVSNRIFSETVLLNNISLSLVDDKYIPNIEPVVLTNTKGVDISLPAGRIGFWVAPDLKVESCIEHDGRNVDEEQLRKSSKRSNLIGDDEQSDDEKANEVTDNSQEDTESLINVNAEKQINAKNEKLVSIKVYRKNSTWEILRSLRKMMKGRLENFEEQNVLSTTSMHEEPKRRESDEEFAEALSQFKTRLLKNSESKVDNGKTAAKSLFLITKIERTLEKLATTSKPRLIESSIGTPRSEKAKQRISASLQKYLRSLDDLLNRANLEESREATRSKKNIIEREVRRCKRETDKKVTDDPLGLRKEATLRKRSKIEELKDRRIERKPRRKEDFKKELSAPFDPRNSESGENNFYGFFRKEPLKNFPEADVYLATGDSSQENDYDYVKDDDVSNEEQSITMQQATISVKDHDNPSEISAKKKNSDQEYFPYEFSEQVKTSKHDFKDDRIENAEIWEAELYKKDHDEDDKSIDSPDMKVIQERDPDEHENRDANERSMKNLAAYYGLTNSPSDRKKNYEELQAAFADLVTRPANKLVSSDKNYNRDRKWAVSTNSKIKLYDGSATKIRTGDVLKDSIVDDQIYDAIREGQRSKRDTNHMALLLDQEMISEDDENLKDCQCRVIRDFVMESPKQCSCRSKRSTYDQTNEESVVDDPVPKTIETISKNQETTDINNSSIIKLVSPQETLDNMDMIETVSETPDAENREVHLFQFPTETSASYDDYIVDIVATNGPDEEGEHYDAQKQSIVPRHVSPFPLSTPENKLQDASTYQQITTEANEPVSIPIEHTFKAEEVSDSPTLSQNSGDISRVARVSSIQDDTDLLDDLTNSSTDNPSYVTSSLEEEATFFREDVESTTEKETTIRTFRSPLEIDSYLEKSDNSYTAGDATQKTTASVLDKTKASESQSYEEPPESEDRDTTLQPTISPMEDSKNAAESNDDNDKNPTRSVKRRADSDESSNTKFANRKSTRKPQNPTVEASRNRKPNPRPVDAARLKSFQRAEDLIKVKEDRLTARLKALLALRRENENKSLKRNAENSQRFARDEAIRYEEYQKRREEQVRRLKEKLRLKRERLLQQYRDELLSAVGKINDEEKRNVKRREVWERIKERDDFRDMIDREKLAYILTYKPVDYRTVKRENREIVDREKTYGVPVEIVRLKNVRERMVQPRDHRSSRDVGIVRYDDLYEPLERTIRLKIPQEKRGVVKRERYNDDKRGSGKSYRAILEDLEDPWMFEYQRNTRQESGDTRKERKLLSLETSDRKIYVIDPSTYRGGEPLLQIYDDRSGRDRLSSDGKRIDKSKEIKNLKYYHETEDNCGENFPTPGNEAENSNNGKTFQVLNISEKYDLPETNTTDQYESLTITPFTQQNSNKTDVSTTEKEIIADEKINSGPEETIETIIVNQTNDNNTSARNANGKKKMENTTKEYESSTIVTEKNMTEQTTESSTVSVGKNIDITASVTPTTIQQTIQQNVEHNDDTTTKISVTEATNVRQKRDIDSNLETIQPYYKNLKKRSSYICLKTDSRETSEEKTSNLYKLVKEEDHYKAVPVKSQETNQHGPILGATVEQYDPYGDKYKNPKYDRLASRNMKQDMYLLASNDDPTEDDQSDEASAEYIDILVPPKSSKVTNPLMGKSHGEKLRYEDDGVSDETSELGKSDERLMRSFPKTRSSSKYNLPTDSLEEYFDQSSSYSAEFGNQPYISETDRDINNNDDAYVSLEDILDSNKHRILMLLPQSNQKFNRPRRQVKDRDRLEKNQEANTIKKVSSSSVHAVTTTHKSPMRKYLFDITVGTADDPKHLNNPSIMDIDEKRKNLFNINPRHTSDTSFVSSNKIDDLTEQSIPIAEYAENNLGQSFTDQQKIQKNRINSEDNGLPSFIEGTIPKLQNVIIDGFEKAQNITGSMERFIEKFDEKFNETLKTDGQQNVEHNRTSVNTTNDAFHSTILNIKKFFTFLSGITHILRG